ncbi:hypothetical protein [Caloranaerobacter sp. DY30410]|uniref:hypothetical protein n=1 Tax=Caloranaerobacter sp. DY30410 TaxID=3238305 RepID=UPI003D0338E2
MKNKRIKMFITLTLSLIMILSILNISYAIVENNIKIFIDNKELVIPPEYGKVFIDDTNRTQIPVRIVA